MTNQILLEQQSALYGEHTRNLESWKRDHEAAMLCHEAENAIGLGLAVLAGIRRQNNEWAREVEMSPSAFSWEHAEFVAGRYRWWHETTSPLLRVVEFCEGFGFVVDGASDLRREHQEISLMSLDTDRARDSILSLEEGRGIPSQQAMNVLRDHLRGPGT